MAGAALGGPGASLAHARNRAFSGAFRRAAPRAGPARSLDRRAGLSPRHRPPRLAAAPPNAPRHSRFGGLRQRLRLAPALQLQRHFSFAARRGRAVAEPRVAPARAQPRGFSHRASPQSERAPAPASRPAPPATAPPFPPRAATSD